jgi:hypothetical protein
MKFLTFFTTSHKILFDEYFEKSFKNNFKDCELITKNFEKQHCESASYHQRGWGETQRNKLNFVIEEASKFPGEIFVFCDADIVFIKNFKEDIISKLQTYELVCQRSYSKNNISENNRRIIKHSMCSGFYAFISNKNNLDFLKLVRDSIVDDVRADQYYFNLYKDLINFDLLGDEYPNIGLFTDGKVADKNLSFDKETISKHNLIHCNWTSNFKEKYDLMKKVFNTFYE